MNCALKRIRPQSRFGSFGRRTLPHPLTLARDAIPALPGPQAWPHPRSREGAVQIMAAARDSKPIRKHL